MKPVIMRKVTKHELPRFVNIGSMGWPEDQFLLRECLEQKSAASKKPILSCSRPCPIS